MDREPAIAPPGTSCAEAVSRMAAEKSDSLLIVDGDGRLRGILTEQDVTRRVALRLPGETPVDDVMSEPVLTIGDGDYLYHAVAVMRRAHLRHMPVVDAASRVVGELHLNDALAAAASQLVELIDRLTHETTLDGLRQVKAAQVEVADALFADDLPAPEVQRLLSELNRDIYRRLIARAIDNMAGNGWGVAPPVDFAAIVMGSGGRGESFLFPDQDNGFVLADYADAEHNRIDAYFIELAGRMTDALDTVGIPYCLGNVMATNPVWRKTLPQWRAQIDIWMRRRSRVAVQLSDIFFDFTNGYGDEALSAALRSHVTGALQRSPGFLRDMYGIDADHKVALGWFGRLLSEHSDDAGEETIDLKYNGTLPLVKGARLYALRGGIAATSTLDRIDALHAAGVLDADEKDYLSGAFRHITDLLLRQQIAEFKARGTAGNRVPVSALSAREKDMLVDGFRAIEAFRERISGDLTGELF